MSLIRRSRAVGSDRGILFRKDERRCGKNRAGLICIGQICTFSLPHPRGLPPAPALLSSGPRRARREGRAAQIRNVVNLIVFVFFFSSFQGDYIWIEPISGREFDVAIGARVVSAEGRRIQVKDDDNKVTIGHLTWNRVMRALSLRRSFLSNRELDLARERLIQLNTTRYPDTAIFGIGVCVCVCACKIDHIDSSKRIRTG